MQFLAPLYLAGAALIALPIVLHLLRRDVAPRVPFTAVRLLRTTAVDRSRSRRLRDLLLLAARIAALLLLAASFARPYRLGAAASSPLTIVAVDRSFSLGAPGVFERARNLASAAIDGAEGRVALVAFDDRADIVSPPGLAADARSALAKLAPGAGATRYAPLMEKAAELAAGSPGARLVVVSDLQRGGFAGARVALPQAIDLVVRDVDGPASNVAVTDVRAAAESVTVVVRNFGRSPAQVPIALESGSTVIGKRTVTVDASSASDVVFEGTPHGSLRATIDDGGGYQADNERFALASAPKRPPVLVVSGGAGSSAGFYVTRALAAAGDEGPDFDVRPISGSAFSGMNLKDAAQYPAVIVLSTHGLDRRAADVFKGLLAAGGGLMMAAGPDVDPAVMSALLGWRSDLVAANQSDVGVLEVSDGRHPIFRPFDAVTANFGQISVQRAWRLRPDDAWHIVATYSGAGPALLERRDGQGRVLLFTSDLDRRWNDFPLHASFVPFMQETARYLGAVAPEATAWTIADLPPGEPQKPGVARVAGVQRVVNVDARESATDRVSPAAFAKLVERTDVTNAPSRDLRAAEVEAGQGWWRYGLGLMLFTLVAEAFVGSR